MMFELIVLTAIFEFCCCRLSGVRIFMDFGMCWKDSCLHCFLCLSRPKLMKLVKILLSRCSCNQLQSESLCFCLSQKDWGRLPILSGVLLALLDLPKLLIVKLFVSFRSFERFHRVPSWEVAKQWLYHWHWWQNEGESIHQNTSINSNQRDTRSAFFQDFNDLSSWQVVATDLRVVWVMRNMTSREFVCFEGVIVLYWVPMPSEFLRYRYFWWRFILLLKSDLNFLIWAT